MRTRICFLSLLSVAAQAQSPAPSNVRGSEYPAIHSDLRVTFRVKAPTAQSVAVQPSGSDNGMGKGPFAMTRGEDGTWALTTPPVRPGFHYYQLLIDGVAVNDPASETFFGWGRQTSGLEAPDKGLDFYDDKAVPHGDVRIHHWHSRVTGTVRRAFVYTPLGYDRDDRTRYPVLYLQHGAGESERAWTSQGRAGFILDNLIASGRARPMIVVMENGYAARAGVPAARGNEGFEEMLVKDLVPEIDTSYRTLAGREHRAVAGLSMGAGQAMTVGLTHLDLFAWIGAFSGAARNADLRTSWNGALSDGPAANEKIRLLWIGYGTEDAGYAAGKALHEKLEAAGVKHVWLEGPGSHEWQVWRKHLHDFAPRLFR